MHISGISIAPIDASPAWTASHNALQQAGIDPAQTAVATLVLGYGGHSGYSPEADVFTGHALQEDLRRHGLSPVLLNHACASVLFALDHARTITTADDIEAVLIVGAIAPTTFDTSGMEALGALSHGTARPFHPDRDGTSLGSGQYALVCEPEHLLRERGRCALGRVLSTSCRVAAEPRASLEAAAILRRITAAIDEASVPISRIEAHATGTVAGDAVEAEVLTHVMDKLTHEVAWGSVRVNASKENVGHFLHGAGAVSLYEALRATQAGDNVLVNAFGFSGNYASAVVTAPADGIPVTPLEEPFLTAEKGRDR